MKKFSRYVSSFPLFIILFTQLLFIDTYAPGKPINKIDITVNRFLELSSEDKEIREQSLQLISRNWQSSFTPMILEVIYLTRQPDFAIRLIELLEEKTSQNFGYDLNRWYEWMWNREPDLHPHYADFKSTLYGLIDPKFKLYFNSNRTAKIRLDEVLWGGVVQDGIPPLRQPKMISVTEADYLDDNNIVFGLEINGDARAYPKRIMAWHEMFIDNVGGKEIAGVYCTLCGSMIIYKTVYNGLNHKLGTSGFLYRSNKLMYDQDTQSLWNTLWGKPVIGPLADRNISLEHLSVVTTKWGEWRKRHPKTKVLSIETGYRRDYSEGVAYRGYFATDELMFNVPKLDKRLKNKDEVLCIRLNQHPDKPLAISVNYLSKHKLYHDRVGDMEFVIFTDNSGASRVYEANGIDFMNWYGERAVFDENGNSWILSENYLKSSDGSVLHRLPAHRAFWFGWYSAYSHTRLVQ